MNSNIVKPKKFGHLHLVYHFTIPLKLWLWDLDVPTVLFMKSYDKGML